jgi:hypothetical protein
MVQYNFTSPISKSNPYVCAATVHLFGNLHFWMMGKMMQTDGGKKMIGDILEFLRGAIVCASFGEKRGYVQHRAALAIKNMCSSCASIIKNPTILEGIVCDLNTASQQNGLSLDDTKIISEGVARVIRILSPPVASQFLHQLFRSAVGRLVENIEKNQRDHKAHTQGTFLYLQPPPPPHPSCVDNHEMLCESLTSNAIRLFFSLSFFLSRNVQRNCR